MEMRYIVLLIFQGARVVVGQMIRLHHVAVIRRGILVVFDGALHCAYPLPHCVVRCVELSVTIKNKDNHNEIMNDRILQHVMSLHCIAPCVIIFCHYTPSTSKHANEFEKKSFLVLSLTRFDE